MNGGGGGIGTGHPEGALTRSDLVKLYRIVIQLCAPLGNWVKPARGARAARLLAHLFYCCFGRFSFFFSLALLRLPRKAYG